MNLYYLFSYFIFITCCLGVQINDVDDENDITVNALSREVRGCRLEKKVSEQDLRNDITALKSLLTGPDRSVGSIDHNKTGEFILNRLDKLKDFYEISTEQVNSYPYSSNTNFLKFGEKEITLYPYIYTRPVRFKNVKDVDVVKLNTYGCQERDYPLLSSNTLVIVQDGGCHIEVKKCIMDSLGVRLLLVNSSTPQEISSKVEYPEECQYCGSSVLPFKVSNSDAEYLSNLKQITSNVTIFSNSTVDMKAKSLNIIAESKSGRNDSIILVGTNYDSYPNTPGINDNAAAVIALLNIANYLTEFDLQNKVRFVFWGSKLFRYNLDGEPDDSVKMYLIYNNIGSTNYMNHIYYPHFTQSYTRTRFIREKHIADSHAEFFDKNGIPWKQASNPSYLFFDNNTPTGGLYAGTDEIKTIDEVALIGGQLGPYDPCNLKSCDTEVNYKSLFNNTRAAAYAIGNYAKNLTSFTLMI
ncbi:uncharacterized protein RJT21DRAFT_133084 [Scheffersomyces amazonensis]|uniref:uncharacterized protein n=1 Tax=Scheffersomyces amazonensis TaxID=1078765 RepID=UPI00315D9C6B